MIIAESAAPLMDDIIDAPTRLKAKAYGAAGILDHAEAFRLLYRLAAKRLHPDSGIGGEGWHKLQRAKDKLEAHHMGRS